jgi:hypothetical protein
MEHSRLAFDTKKDVIPCVIFGTKEAIPISKGFYLLPTRLKMDFLPQVSSEGIKAGELKDKVFEIMKSHYLSGGKINGHRYSGHCKSYQIRILLSSGKYILSPSLTSKAL